MNRTFDDFLRDFDVPGRNSGWPQIELSEKDDELTVVAELPGLEDREIEASIEDGVLRLRGEKKVEKGGTFYSERWAGVFERIIPVGQDVDPDKVKASFKNGLLTVRLPKKPEASRRARVPRRQSSGPGRSSRGTLPPR
jgi:HSP20 family protein